MENPGTSQGHMSSLVEKLQARTEQTRQEIEKLTDEQFKTLSESLSASSRNALSTTESDIAREIEAMRSRLSAKCSTVSLLFGSRLLQMFLLGLAMLLGLLAGGWGLMAWLGSQVQALNQEISTLSQAKEIEQQTLSKLHRKTWGIQLETVDGKKYIILDQGSKATTTATTRDGRQALELK
jgi:cell division protein FtsB